MKIEGDEKLILADATLHRSITVKLAYVAQDRIGVAEAVKCVTHARTAKRTHATSQEIRSVLDQESKMRTDMCTTAS